MVDIQVMNTSFVLGAHHLGQLPGTDIPEIAIVGRSNVGKSTLINRLLNRRNLARTSSTPGRTQELNFFNVEILQEGQRQQFHLVDLPGFGFARFSKQKRDVLSRLIVDYLTSRPHLLAVCLLNDCRRDPGADELAVHSISTTQKWHLIPVVTKYDKLKQGERKPQLATIAAAYKLDATKLVITGTKTSTEQLWGQLVTSLTDKE